MENGTERVIFKPKWQQNNQIDLLGEVLSFIVISKV